MILVLQMENMEGLGGKVGRYGAPNGATMNLMRRPPKAGHIRDWTLRT